MSYAGLIYNQHPGLEIVNIEVSSLCNASCPMCLIRERKSKRQHASSDILKKAIDDSLHFSPLPRLVFAGTGEPTLHPQCMDWIEYAVGKGFYTILLTNASRLDADLAERVLKSGLKEIVLSLDGVTKESFEKVRRGLNFETCWQNVNTFLEMDIEHSPLEKVWVQMVNMPQNHHELYAFATHFAPKAGRKVIVFLKNPISFPNFGQEYHFLHEDIGLSMPGVLVDPVRIPSYKATTCTQLFTLLNVLANGDVVPCCLAMDDYWGLGNLREQSLKDIFSGDKLAGYRRLWNTHQIDKIPLCSECAKWH